MRNGQTAQASQPASGEQQAGLLSQMILEQLARIGKAMGSEHRLAMVEFLSQGERTVESLAAMTRLSVANTSQHLQLLRQIGMVSTRKQGLYVFYRLVDDSTVRLLQTLRQVGKRHLAEVDRLVSTMQRGKDQTAPVSRAMLMSWLMEGAITVVDLRPEEEYKAGHIPSAINIPWNQMDEQIEHLAKNQAIIFYCRGPYCQMALDAATRLRALGYQAYRLEEGFPEWRCADLPVEYGSMEEVAASI